MTAPATATNTPRRGRGRNGPAAAAAAAACLLLLLLLLLLSPLSAEGFQGCGVVRTTAKVSSPSPLFLNGNKASETTEERMDGLTSPSRVAPIQRALATTAAAWMTAAVLIPAASAWAATASSSEADEYVYGSVDAPVGLAVGAGILAIATAALPVLLRGGEEAFEEIRERDEGTFGSPDKNKDVLKSRRK
jgi:hypothetical protein